MVTLRSESGNSNYEAGTVPYALQTLSHDNPNGFYFYTEEETKAYTLSF